jgi:hypothetical protein
MLFYKISFRVVSLLSSKLPSMLGHLLTQISHYSRVFGTATAFPCVWFNYQQDTLYVHEKNFSKSYVHHFELVS